MVKLRLISDVHYTDGINASKYKTKTHSPFGHYFAKELAKEKDCITLIAGDIAEGSVRQKNFFETYFPNQTVIFTEGNHLVYDLQDSILPKIKKNLKKSFPIFSGNYHYLENDWMFIPGTNQEVAVIGSTFYTDYEYCNFTVDEYNESQSAWDTWSILYGLPTQPTAPINHLTKTLIRKENMFRAGMYLNDFRWGRTSENESLKPSDYLSYHKKAKKEIKRCYDQILEYGPNIKIILMTHHCLSPKCIDDKYVKSKINASYVSDLEDWIDTMPNIRLVLSGHVHCRKDLTIGKNNTRYIINACGYIPRNEPFKAPKFNPNLIIDTNDL